MFKTKSYRVFINLLVLANLLWVVSCGSKSKSENLTSPDGKYEYVLDLKTGFEYSLNWNNQQIITNSKLGFQLTDGTYFPGNLVIENIELASVDKEWEPVYGEQNLYSEKYNEKLITFSGDHPKAKEFALRIRAYNEGVAFRYEFKGNEGVLIDEELTEFTFAKEPNVWATSEAQGEVKKYKLSEIDTIVERPLLAELSDTTYVALGEAAMVDFTRMKFEKTGSTVLKADLERGPVDSEIENGELDKKHDIKILSNAYNTPWRFVMAAGSPSKILQNNFLVLNLNEENKIADPSFIKPGKVIREVTLTTQGGIACVDFAKKHNLEYIEFDAGWYGNEYDMASDATTITVDPNRSPGPLELHKIIKYAKENGVGVILYVNRRALEQQLDEVLPLLKSWGVDGIKYGFVNSGPQKWTRWLHDATRKAAENGLMVDIHDKYRPTGYSRTYPNIVTQEGIRGDEEAPTNDLVINTIFTRMIAGAGDQTNCYFAERVSERMSSRASQMAKSICVYSPWQFLYWYDRPVGSPIEKGGAGDDAVLPIPEIEDLKYYDQLPTVWDESKIIGGYPDEFAVIARKNKDAWFLGALAGTKPYELNVKLDFLDKNKKYTATIFSDNASLETYTKLQIQEIEVTSESSLKQSILKQNGLAVIFKPLN